MKQSGSDGAENVGVFQIVILLLSVVVLGALGVDTVLKLPKQISGVLQILDTSVCVLLFIDFWMRLYRAESKLAFLKWGWIDLVASIPNLPILRIGRFVRILRIIRLLRAIRATQKISTILFKEKLKTGVASVVMTAFLLVIFCSIGELICEQQNPDSNIKTAGDAIWWSVTTITTVGYGDKYPTTSEGRIVAMILMVGGIGLFGILSGLAASFFVGSKEGAILRDENKILVKLQKLEEKIDSMKREG